jgi:EAL domain-containing protein (putative c-di-GMP-specific phosphodiesterase class I)
MADALEVGVTAEGVETSEQLARLRERGCTFAQGYLFGRPVPAEELTRLLGSGIPDYADSAANPALSSSWA